MGIKIEKKVPPPKSTNNVRYPFKDMGEGDSFFVTEEEVTNIESVVQSAYRYGKRHNQKFVARTQEEKGKKGVRIWRVKPE